MSVGSGASSDAEYFAAAQKGDHQAFTYLYARYRRAVLSHCRRALADPDEAEEVAQETFVRAWAHIGSFDPQRPPLPWLISIARRLCIDRWRSRESTPSSTVRQDVPLEQWEDRGTDTWHVLERSELRMRLQAALQSLNPRYRRVLMLHEFEGWSHKDIAAAEGSTVTSVAKVLARARERARASLQESEPVVGLLAPLPLLRRLAGRLHHAARRSKENLRTASGADVSGQGYAACMQSLCTGLLAFALTFGGGILRLTPAGALSEPPSLREEPSTTTADGPASHHFTASSTARARRADREAPQTSGDLAFLHDFARYVETVKDPTPDDTQLTSFVVSPNYARDRTIFAAGSHSGDRKLLFVSRDGGGTWKRLPATFFGGGTLLLPPAYPRDARIFAMGLLGLQRSDDEGKTFHVVSPLQGRARISPAFNAGDPRIVIGRDVNSNKGWGEGMYEYRADSRTTAPIRLPLPPRATYSEIEFSPDYTTDRTLFVAGKKIDATSDGGPGAGGPVLPRRDPVVYRCRADSCTEVSGAENLRFMRFSGRSNGERAYIWGGDRVLSSDDSGETFAPTTLPSAFEAIDFTVGRLAGIPRAALIVSTPVWQTQGGIVRSVDEGKTWTRLGWLGETAFHVVATPTGRLIAALGNGLACSEDAGETWAARCTPERAA